MQKMKVQLINTEIENFLVFIKNQADPGFFFKWDCVQTFETNWDLTAEDLVGMYDRSFQNARSNRLWSGRKYSPKESMLAFLKFDADFCKSMFYDLFDESKDVNLRISRFIHHCNDLYDRLPAGRDKILDHYHTHKMVSLYLAFAFPQDHCLFDPDLFAGAGEKIGLKNPPQSYEYDRFIKLTKTVRLLLSKYQELINSYPLETDNSMIMVHDFYEWLGSSRT